MNVWKAYCGAGESSRFPLPPQKETPRKEKLLEEVKTPLPQRLGKEAIGEVSGEVPPTEFQVAKPLTVLVVTLETKAKKMESPAPSPQKLKKNVPTLEYEELGDSTEETGSSDGGTKSEEEAKLATPLAEKRKSVNTRSSGKKPLPVYKTPLAPKREAKIP